MDVTNIKSPEDIRALSVPQLEELAQDIRQFLIESLSHTGGHLSGNLGVVELSLALHKVFHSPQDKFIFDVGHQSYVHKILTGRGREFNTLRRKDGLCGYQKRSESPHDSWEAGHSSTSLSAALGMAAARDIKGEYYEVIPIIGDGALTGGMAFEALNDIGAQQRKVIIIFNDNNMSISRNHSGIEKGLTRWRTSELYRSLKKDIKQSLGDAPNLMHSLQNVRDALKQEMIHAPLFQSFNLDYLGPVDGHNISDLIQALETAKEHDGPIVVHVITQKGRGYKPAEQDRTGVWHGVGPFNPETGRFYARLPEDHKSWSEIISLTLLDLAKTNPDLAVITPAMAQGSKLYPFAEAYPQRFFDCGIAEQHAVTMAGGMAAAGIRPFVSIYSSFAQRAYDQLSHDVARMQLPVVFGIDRAGLVGDDGETHQGIYDIAFMRTIPGIILSQPKDAKEAQNLLYSAFAQQEKPWAIRYPRGNALWQKNAQYDRIEPGTWTHEVIGRGGQTVIAYGPDVDAIAALARSNNLDLDVVNARFFRPLDENMLAEIFAGKQPVTVYETDTKTGGLSSAILEWMNEHDIEQELDIVGLEEGFVPHGSIKALRHLEHISLEDLFERLEKHAAR